MQFQYKSCRVRLGDRTDRAGISTARSNTSVKEECGDRVLRRFGHQTLPASDSSLEAEGSASALLMWMCLDVSRVLKASEIGL